MDIEPTIETQIPQRHKDTKTLRHRRNDMWRGRIGILEQRNDVGQIMEKKGPLSWNVITFELGSDTSQMKGGEKRIKSPS